MNARSLTDHLLSAVTLLAGVTIVGVILIPVYLSLYLAAVWMVSHL